VYDPSSLLTQYINMTHAGKWLVIITKKNQFAKRWVKRLTTNQYRSVHVNQIGLDKR